MLSSFHLVLMVLGDSIASSSDPLSHNISLTICVDILYIPIILVGEVNLHGGVHQNVVTKNV